jgi:hypothetical protein
MEIIVSRYNEDLQWTLDEPFCNYKYTVYNKGSNENFVKDNVNKIINVQNVGCEAHTYLYHIIHNYEKLEKITVFLVGSIEVPCKINKAIKTLELIQKTNQATFYAEYSENVYKHFYDFTIKFWGGTNDQNGKINCGYLHPCEFTPFHKWYENHFDKDDVVHCWSYNSIFSFDKQDILQHPKEKYEKLIKGLEKGINLEEGHYIERAWGAVFHPLIHTQIVYRCDDNCTTEEDETKSYNLDINVI